MLKYISYMQFLNHYFSLRVFFFFFSCFSLVFLSLSFTSYWSFSEIYPAHSAQYLFSPENINYLFSLKPIYNFILYLFYKLSEVTSLYPMEMARIGFAINGLCLLILMMKWIQKNTNSYNAILSALILMGSFVFLERGYRVRSDLLVSTFNLLSLFLASHWCTSKSFTRLVIVLGVFFGTLMISPKAIYWIIFTSSIFFYELKKYDFSKSYYLKAIGLLFVGVSIISLLFKDFLFIGALKDSGLYYIFNIKQSWLFLQDQGNLFALFSKKSHLPHFIEHNFFICFLVIVKIVFVIDTVFRNKKWDALNTSFVLLIILFLIHPQQKIFFICALMPYLLICFFTDSKWIAIQSQYSSKFKFLLLICAYMHVIYMTTYSSYGQFKHNNTQEQKKTLKTLNTFFKDKTSIDIYDPNHLLYTRKTYNWFIETPAAIKQVTGDYFNRLNIDVILASSYLHPSDVFEWRQKNFKFIHIDHHIYYKALILNQPFAKEVDVGQWFLNLDKKEQQFLNHSEKKYWYTALDSRLYSMLPVLKTDDCYANRSILKPGCLYSQEEFLKGKIRMKHNPIGLFYVEPIKGLDSNLSLRLLFGYDLHLNSNLR